MNDAEILAKPEELIGVWNGSEFPTQETTIVLCEDGRGLYFYYHGSDDRGTFVDEFQWKLQENKLNLIWINHSVPRWATPDYDDSQSELDEDEYLSLNDYHDTVACWFSDAAKLRLILAIDIDFACAPALSRLQANPIYEQERARLKDLAADFDPFSADRQVWIVGEDGWAKASVTTGRFAQGYRPIPGAHRLPIVLGCLGLVLTAPMAAHQHHPDPIYILAMLPPLGILANFKAEPAPPPLRRVFLSLAFWYCLMGVIILMGNVAHHWQGAWRLPMALIIIGIYPCVLIFAQEIWRHINALRSFISTKR